jgi:hypothetical protein
LEYRAGLLAKGGSSRRLEDSEHHRTSKTITSRDGVSVSMHQSRCNPARSVRAPLAISRKTFSAPALRSCFTCASTLVRGSPTFPVPVWERLVCANSRIARGRSNRRGLNRQAGRKRRCATVPPGGQCTKASRAFLACSCTPLPSSEGTLQGAARVTVPPSLRRKVWLEPISEGF